MFKVVIIGDSKFKDYDTFEKKCKYYLKPKAKEGITIITTSSNSFDDMVHIFAEKYKITVEFYRTDWKEQNKIIIKNRNNEILEKANGVIAFWDKKTYSIKNFIDLSIEKKIPIRIHDYTNKKKEEI